MPQTSGSDIRRAIAQAKRIVVKVGTRVLVDSNGKPSMSRISWLVRDLSAVQQAGREVVLVTSGAIGSGMEALGLKARPTTIPELQMAAAVGQSRLMSTYHRLFEKSKIAVGQVLLTHDDLMNRSRHLNARNTMMKLLENRIIPIVNENDVVTVDEIKFGDNDLLASLVALLVDADLLILLTNVDGLRAPARNGKTRRVAYLECVTDTALGLTKGKGSHLSIGGMASKLKSAQSVVDVGGKVIIADGTKRRVLQKIVEGKDVGTLIGYSRPDRDSTVSSRQRWLMFFHKPKGTIVVDGGASSALVERGRSLLPAGIKGVSGSFDIGSLVTIKSEDGETVGRGLVAYSSREIDKIKGCRSSEISRILGFKHYDEVIHRDNMVLLGGSS